jgi:hypothetical protein
MSENIPNKYKEYLGNHSKCIFDSDCGECVGWGYKVIKHCGDEIWRELQDYGEMNCIYPTWYLIVKKLSFDDAIKKYGEVNNLVVGPRGGFKSVNFGGKQFCQKNLDPRINNYEIMK